MNKPLAIPAAWRGSELFSRPDWLHELQPDELDELHSALQQIPDTDTPFESLDRESISLPRLSPVLHRIQDSLENGSGAAMIRGWPIDNCDLQQLRHVFWCVCQHIGTPVSQAATGERMFSVRDAGFADGAKQRGPNTRKRLSYHTDRCDVIGFLCVRQAKSGGENFVVSSVTLHNQMLRERPDLVDVLMKPFYYQRHNVDAGNQRPYCQQPIFSIYEGFFAANLLRVLIERAYAAPEIPDMTSIQREALDYLEMLADRPDLHVKFRQEPGDILFLNNFVTFHRRAEFVDFERPEQKRHLLRVWLSVPNSRPLHPDFAANYGATAAGALRGGMRPARGL